MHLCCKSAKGYGALCMQLELPLKLTERENEAKSVLEIEGFHLDFPDATSYYGEIGDDNYQSLPEHCSASHFQQELFSFDNKFIELSISDFVLATKCPKIFAAYKISHSIKRPPHHKIFDIGTFFDSAAKEFLSTPIHTRKYVKQAIIGRLSKKLIKLNVNKCMEYLKAFNLFCQYFQNWKTISLGYPLKFKLGPVILTGNIDFILEHKKFKYQTLLIDFKLNSVGNDIFHLNLSDLLQLFTYAVGLYEKDMPVKSVGYYFLHESALLYQNVNKMLIESIKEKLKQLLISLMKTQTFKPRKCAYCLICELKENCSVGKSLTYKDYAKPLK